MSDATNNTKGETMTPEWRISEVDNGGWGIEFVVEFRSGGHWIPGKVFRTQADAQEWVHDRR